MTLAPRFQKFVQAEMNLPADNIVVLFEAVARLARPTAAATTDWKNMTAIEFELDYREIRKTYMHSRLT